MYSRFPYFKRSSTVGSVSQNNYLSCLSVIPFYFLGGAWWIPRIWKSNHKDKTSMQQIKPLYPPTFSKIDTYEEVQSDNPTTFSIYYFVFFVRLNSQSKYEILDWGITSTFRPFCKRDCSLIFHRDFWFLFLVRDLKILPTWSKL